MESSIKLFRISGIDIRMHLTFPLILIWAALQYGLLLGQGLAGAFFGIVVTLLLFGIVVLHELGHSYAARRYGIPVRRIVLLPIGGVAELERLPEKPSQELVVALAGPAVNFALAALFWAVGQSLRLGGAMDLGAMGDVLQPGVLADFGAAIFRYVFAANLFIGLFNLLPAFPLDGGRVLRALLALRLDYARATALAVAIGQTMAWIFGLWGVLSGNFFTLILAVFVYLAASQEGRMIQVRSTLSGIRVGQAFSRRALALGPYDPVSRAVEATLQSFQADFPVVDVDGRLIGLVTAADVMQALRRQQEAAAISQIMRTDFPQATPGEYIFDVQQRMAAAGIDAAPVVESGRFVGLLTNRDIGELYQLLSINPQLLGQRAS
jgi:Zn-dependent protease/CBS domain-containing protein